jgi:hypothetical protein
MNCEFLTLLFLAIGKDCSRIVVEYLDPSGDVVLEILQTGWSECFGWLTYCHAMQAAVTHGLVDAARCMIEIGRSRREYLFIESYLDIAVSSGYPDICDLLFRNGADKIGNVLNNSLLLASKNDRLNVIKFMLSKGANNYVEALGAAASRGFVDIVLYLIENVYLDKDEALLLMSKYENIQVIRHLVGKHNYTIGNLTNAYDIAEVHSSKEVLNYLLRCILQTLNKGI